MRAPSKLTKIFETFFEQKILELFSAEKSLIQLDVELSTSEKMPPRLYSKEPTVLENYNGFHDASYLRNNQGRGGRLVVIVLVFNSDDPSSNPAEIENFSVDFVFVFELKRSQSWPI